MADVYTVTFIIIGILLSWPALLLALNLLLPATIGRIEGQLAASPMRAFLVGLPVTGVFLVVMAIAADAGSGLLRGGGYLMGGLLLALWLLGGASVARLMGNRMSAMSDHSELSRLVRGTAVFVLAISCPIVGWFLFLPLTSIIAIGAAVSGARRGAGSERNESEAAAISAIQG